MGVLKDLHGGERELLVSVHIQMAWCWFGILEVVYYWNMARCWKLGWHRMPTSSTVPFNPREGREFFISLTRLLSTQYPVTVGRSCPQAKRSAFDFHEKSPDRNLIKDCSLMVSPLLYSSFLSLPSIYSVFCIRCAKLLDVMYELFW
jgi:hypothetical protein